MSRSRRDEEERAAVELMMQPTIEQEIARKEKAMKHHPHGVGTSLKASMKMIERTEDASTA
mgnify:CR=1 FL=1